MNTKNKIVFGLPRGMVDLLERSSKEDPQNQKYKLVGYVEYDKYVIPVVAFNHDGDYDYCPDIWCNDLDTNIVYTVRSSNTLGCICINASILYRYWRSVEGNKSNQSENRIKAILYAGVSKFLSSSFFTDVEIREFVSAHLGPKYVSSIKYSDSKDYIINYVYQKRISNTLKFMKSIHYTDMRYDPPSEDDIIKWLHKNEDYKDIECIGTIKYDYGMWQIPLIINHTVPTKTIDDDVYLDMSKQITITAVMKRNSNYYAIVIGSGVWKCMDQEDIIPLLYHEIAHIIDPEFFNESLADQFAVAHIGADRLAESLSNYRTFLQVVIKQFNEDKHMVGINTNVNDIIYRVEMLQRYNKRIEKRIKICLK